MAGTIEREPDRAALPANTPSRLRELLRDVFADQHECSVVRAVDFDPHRVRRRASRARCCRIALSTAWASRAPAAAMPGSPTAAACCTPDRGT